MPRASATVIAGRVHDDGLWLAAVDGDQVFRWLLVDDVIVEDGEYAEAAFGPAYIATESGVLDGNVDFVHYREDELPEHAVKIHGSKLFTGP